MTNRILKRCMAALTTVLLGAAIPASAWAQAPVATEHRPSLAAPFVQALGDLGRLRSWKSATWLSLGAGAAAATRPADRAVTREFVDRHTRFFKPGALIGATPFQLGAGFAAYAIGRATGHAQVMNVGSDLIRVQLVTQSVVSGMKQATRRTRPDGAGLSFPSGHTAVTFGSATVLQRHYGWKVGAPAYAVASYVAASRLRMQRHYLSDVAFGAVLGIVAGRTVTLAGHHMSVAPLATVDGAGIGLTW